MNNKVITDIIPFWTWNYTIKKIDCLGSWTYNLNYSFNNKDYNIFINNNATYNDLDIDISSLQVMNTSETTTCNIFYTDYKPKEEIQDTRLLLINILTITTLFLIAFVWPFFLVFKFKKRPEKIAIVKGKI